MEKKYIITKKYGKIKHFKFPSCWHHQIFARDNGYDMFSEVLETGMIVDKQIKILECKDRRHMDRRQALTVLSERSMKAREVESRYMYRGTGRREGD